MDEDSGGARGSGHGPARPRATWTDRDLDDAPPALGPMLRRTGSVYRSIWVPALAVLGVATAALIGWLVLGMGLFDLAARGQRSLVLTADGRFKTSGLWVILLEIGLPLLVAIVATYLATLAALADLAAQADAGRPVRASRSLRLAVRRVPSLLGATAMVVGGVVAFVALTPLFMVAGLLGLLATPVVWLARRRAPEADRVAWWPTAGRLLVWCIPLGAAVRLACRWILVLPAVALETNGPRRALRRSSAAVAGRAWRVAAIIVGVYAAYFVVDQLVALVAGRLLSPLVGLVGRLVVQYVLASLPIAAVVVAFRAFAGPTDPERLPALPTRRPGAPTAVVHHTVLLVVFALLAGSGAAVLVGSAAVTAPAAQAAGAATYVVSSLGDEPDASPGDGVCATGGAVCTLRAAVDEATAQPTQSTTITFGVDGTIVLASSLVLATTVHLDGTGHKVRLEPPRSCSDCPWDQVQLIRVPFPTTSYAITNLQLQHGGTSGTAGGGALETAGTGVLRSVTFTANSSQLADGGAVSVTGGSLTGTNLTFWSNSAVNGFGGADIASAGAVSLVNITAFGADGGSMLATGGTFSITNSLLGTNAGATCSGAITGDTNLGSGSCAGFFSEVNGIGTFGDHGGPVDTIDLAGSSYAVDHGLAAPTCPATDARGVTRPQASGCDLGAYEFTPASAPLALTVGDLGVGPDANPGDRVCATAAGVCTLPAAVDEANAEPGRAATVTFAVDGTITVGAPLVPVLSSFTLDGSGRHVTISGNDATALFSMGSGTTYTLRALTLAHGAAGASGGGAVDADATTTGTITGVTFDANSATGGTGGAVRNAGSLSVTNATFSANSASAGADLADAGAATVGSSTFVGAAGGAISSSGPGLTLDNSIVAPASGAGCTGTVTGTTDLSTDGSCPGATSVTPGLAALADNGGDVRTVALAADSPAVDAATGAPCPAVDARGVSRPQLAACDIGAFEYRAPTTPTVFVVDDVGTAGDANPGDGACATATATCTLAAAVAEANATTAALGNATPPSSCTSRPTAPSC